MKAGAVVCKRLVDGQLVEGRVLSTLQHDSNNLVLGQLNLPSWRPQEGKVRMRLVAERAALYSSVYVCSDSVSAGMSAVAHGGNGRRAC